jgi:hypothetical protein
VTGQDRGSLERSVLRVRLMSGVLSRPVASWHALLRASAVVNLGLWLLTAVAVVRSCSGEGGAACRIQLLLSAVYVSGCAFRSALPVYDIPRIVLIDSPLSSVIVGRSVATVAELCFASQWALILHVIALAARSPFGLAVSLAIPPLILLAEGYSWYSVLTTEQRGHAVENSIWGLSAALVVASLWVIGPGRIAGLDPPAIAWCIGGAAYVAFIFGFDVPMYCSRWLADQASGRHYLSLRGGLADLCRRRIVSYRWEDWRSEVLWMSLYFILGVWCSLSLVYASMSFATHRN